MEQKDGRKNMLALPYPDVRFVAAAHATEPASQQTEKEREKKSRWELVIAAAVLSLAASLTD